MHAQYQIGRVVSGFSISIDGLILDGLSEPPQLVLWRKERQSNAEKNSFSR